MKYLTKTKNNEENVFTKPSGYTSARSPRYIIYTSFAHDFTQRFLYSFARDFPPQHFLYSFAMISRYSVSSIKKSPPQLRRGF